MTEEEISGLRGVGEQKNKAKKGRSFKLENLQLWQGVGG